MFKWFDNQSFQQLSWMHIVAGIDCCFSLLTYFFLEMKQIMMVCPLLGAIKHFQILVIMELKEMLWCNLKRRFYFQLKINILKLTTNVIKTKTAYRIEQLYISSLVLLESKECAQSIYTESIEKLFTITMNLIFVTPVSRAIENVLKIPEAGYGCYLVMIFPWVFRSHPYLREDNTTMTTIPTYDHDIDHDVDYRNMNHFVLSHVSDTGEPQTDGVVTVCDGVSPLSACSRTRC